MSLLPKGGAWQALTLRHAPWPPCPVVAPRLDPRQLVEEEKTPYYHPDCFFPARLGQILNGRYQLATKLGYGSSSTVWLARDLQGWRWSKERHVAVKINAVQRSGRADVATNELRVLEHISQFNRGHEGWHFVRGLVDSFSLEGTAGSHLCLVMEPLREPLWLYRKRFVGGVIPPEILKITVQMILQGLDYLDSECKIIHTDLKPDNIMVKIEDPALLEKDARDEYENPLPQKISDGRTMYLSRNNYGPFSATVGIVQITDFGLSVSGAAPRDGCIQAEIYRAPEVVLDAGYSYSADIWSLGVMLWDLLEGRALFNPVSAQADGDYDDGEHLGQMMALMGPPPAALLARGRRAEKLCPGGVVPPTARLKHLDFNNSISVITGSEKDMFLRFVKKMVTWDPNERLSAKELLNDPWLHSDYEQQ